MTLKLTEMVGLPNIYVNADLRTKKVKYYNDIST